MRRYQYVGPTEIAARVGAKPSSGAEVCTPRDVLRWMQGAGHSLDEPVTVTFVITADGILRIADRRSEHVACAGGGEVLSAGEMTFELDDRELRVLEVTNQSTGYCPEPMSWPAVAKSLDSARIPRPEAFTQAFEFRRCSGCGGISLIKNLAFECAVCGAELPTEWNFDPPRSG